MLRLLILQPGTQDQEIICELVKINPTDEHEIYYEALSWCWGSGFRDCRLTIRQRISVFSSIIPQSLLEALVALRLGKSARIL